MKTYKKGKGIERNTENEKMEENPVIKEANVTLKWLG